MPNCFSQFGCEQQGAARAALRSIHCLSAFWEQAGEGSAGLDSLTGGSRCHMIGGYNLSVGHLGVRLPHICVISVAQRMKCKILAAPEVSRNMPGESAGSKKQHFTEPFLADKSILLCHQRTGRAWLSIYGLD